MPTVKEAVAVFLADAGARGLAPATPQKLRTIFAVQLVAFAEESGATFLREFNSRNLAEWRQTWKKEKKLARKKKFERVIGFFWYCARQGWLRVNPAAAMGRAIAKHVPTDCFTADEYERIIDATYRLGEYGERSWPPEKRGIRIRALTEMMRWSGLRIRDAATLECSWLDGNQLLLYQVKTGIPVFVLLRPQVADLRKPDGTPNRCHCHMFRDAFAVEMLLAGVPIDQVSILLAHPRPQVRTLEPCLRNRKTGGKSTFCSRSELHE